MPRTPRFFHAACQGPLRAPRPHHNIRPVHPIRMTTSPAVFLAHGSPMSALGGDAHAAALHAFGRRHADARGILIVSAHWQVSRPLRVTAWDHMPLLYDFGGFPDELYRMTYPAPGDPA